MRFLNDFQFELISQTTIVHYIEYRFEQELNKAKEFLDIEIKENLYDNNSNYMKLLNSICDDLLEKNSQSYIKEKPLPKIARNVDVREPIGEVIQHCVEAIEAGYDLSIEELKEELGKINKMSNDDCSFYDYTEEQLNQIIETAYIVRDYHINAIMEEQDNIINLLKTTIKLVDNSSSSNIFRQSFINIFSIFDAYVFEYLKQFFSSKPNEMGKFFEIKNNEKVKMTLDEILCFDSIENLKIEMVKKQFAGRYLSELISKLKNYKPDIFKDIEYPVLMEMVERRNIHLHNKGYADNKYCSSFNIYKFNVDDYVNIDSEYLFIKVMNTLSKFLTNIENELCI